MTGMSVIGGPDAARVDRGGAHRAGAAEPPRSLKLPEQGIRTWLSFGPIRTYGARTRSSAAVSLGMDDPEIGR